MASFIEGLKLAFTSGVSCHCEEPQKEYLTDAEKLALKLTAAGNVYLSLGEVCTPEEVEDIREEVLRHVA